MAKKLTLARIAAHDFRRALRVWRTYLSSDKIFGQLVSQRARMLAVGMRGLGLAVVGTLWLEANKSEAALKVSVIDATVPAAYVAFGVAVLFFGALLNLINYFLLNDFVRIASDKLFNFDNSSALEILQDGGSSGSLAWRPQYRFLSSGKAHERLGRWVMGLFALPFLATLALAYWTVLSRGLDVLGREGLSVAAAFTIVGWALMLIPIVLAALFYIPFKFTKNTYFIRWSFLAPLYRRQRMWPPRVDYWLAQKP